MPTVEVTYELHPPSNITAPGLTPVTTHDFDVSATRSTIDTNQDYYTALRKSLGEAKAKLGEELTAWRDVVGKEDVGMQKPRQNKDDEDESDEEGGDL
jgi:hypothetical protein